MIKKVLLLFVPLILTFLCGCRTVPVTDRIQLLLTTSGYENQLGAEAYEEYKNEYSISNNKEYNQALNRCGEKISKIANQNEFDWQFVVLESSIQNAFCLPGGKVAVYTGLIDLMKNEAELAFVVGHEIAHAVARHSGERMSWGYLQTLGGILVDLGFQNDVINDIYGTGTQLGVILPFSRSNESEADFIGLLYMAEAGYNPEASVEFWSRFSQGSGSGILGNLMITHPCDKDRIAEMKKNMSNALEIYNRSKEKKGYGIIFRR